MTIPIGTQLGSHEMSDLLGKVKWERSIIHRRPERRRKPE